jgi:predicted nuclease of restriction endonuclease-like (RecB) superfamily
MLIKQFTEIIHLIKQSRHTAIKAVNAELINLYWNVGAYINDQLNNASWGEKTVDELASYIQKNHSELKGFNRRGLYRMKQFYEIYSGSLILSEEANKFQLSENKLNTIVSSPRTQLETLDIRQSILTKLSWTHHRAIFSRCKTEEEREFYLKLSVKENYSVKELERQINSGVFERVMISNIKLSPSLKELHQEIANSFKDSYVFEFLNLSEPHDEAELQKGLLRQMKNFILELGKDFLFIDQEYKLLVGKSDFYIDLLFYHRGLQCLVVFELKADKFKPEQLGKLEFYLEALDRDVKKPNENPGIGILLCKDQDGEVVEYALSRSLSPAMVSEYKTQLPDKKILKQKLHEIFENNNELDR